MLTGLLPDRAKKHPLILLLSYTFILLQIPCLSLSHFYPVYKSEIR